MLANYHLEMINSQELTETEGNGVGSQNEGAPASTEEVADTTKHHKHANGDVHNTATTC